MTLRRYKNSRKEESRLSKPSKKSSIKILLQKDACRLIFFDEKALARGETGNYKEVIALKEFCTPIHHQERVLNIGIELINGKPVSLKTTVEKSDRK